MNCGYLRIRQAAGPGCGRSWFRWESTGRRWEAQREKLWRRDVKNEMNKLPIGTPARNQDDKNTSHTHPHTHTPAIAHSGKREKVGGAAQKWRNKKISFLNFWEMIRFLLNRTATTKKLRSQREKWYGQQPARAVNSGPVVLVADLIGADKSIIKKNGNVQIPRKWHDIPDSLGPCLVVSFVFTAIALRATKAGVFIK